MAKSMTSGANTLIGVDHQDTYGDTKYYSVLTQTDKTMYSGERGHWGYPNFPRNRDVGGPFLLNGVITTRGLTMKEEYWRGGPNAQRYTGSFTGYINPYLPWTLTLDQIDGQAWGAEAYSKLRPTQPVFSALNSIYELREMPGLLRQRFLNSGLKGIGNYYLALKFGWEPLLRDCISLINIQREAQKRLAQLLRDNGKPVRHRITLLNNTSRVKTESGSLYRSLQPVLVTQYYASVPRYTYTEDTSDRVWASAKMRFWLPPGPRDIAWTNNMLRKLYGFQVTPKNVWKAMPWSWLIDWFGNFSFIFDNIGGGVEDKLAADHIYVMREKHSIRTQVSTGTFRKRDGSTFSVSATSSSDAIIKSRVKGGPFDFANSQKSLTTNQLAILGALGLSRLG